MEFTKEQLDVLFFAVNGYMLDKKHVLETFEESSKITGFYNSKFLDHLRSEISICESLKELLVSKLLSHSGLNLEPE